MHFSILGTGHAAPDLAVTNEQLENLVDTTDEWIFTRSGIKERRIMSGETMTDMCKKAAVEALRDADVKPEELDLIICATVKGDYISPSQACLLQHELGANCPAFDINAACSGFLYALNVADAFFSGDKVKKVLVVAMESLSKLVDWHDRATCVLFGDGGGAAVLGAGEGLLSILTTAQGCVDPLNIPHVSGESPFEGEAMLHPTPTVNMSGQEVFKFAVNALARDLQLAIENAGLSQEDIDWVIPHQANIRIIDSAATRLNIPRERFYVNLSRYGNTSAGSIPIALDEMNKEGLLKNGQHIALVSFGAGLTTGACVIRWQK
jgi:3-oxoacyl-(acyl-carrier-protein) synthase III